MQEQGPWEQKSVEIQNTSGGFGLRKSTKPSSSLMGGKVELAGTHKGKRYTW